MKCALLSLLALVGLVAFSVPAGAQSYVNTSLTVNVPPVTGGGVRNLAFGSITPGGTSDTGPGQESNANTAKWRFTGLGKGLAVSMSITAPASLTKGASTLPITWPANYGSWCSYRAAETCAGSTLFTPQSGTYTVNATTAGGGGNNDRVLEVWIGGQLSVPAGAQAGLYTGTMTLTSAQLGT